MSFDEDMPEKPPLKMTYKHQCAKLKCRELKTRSEQLPMVEHILAKIWYLLLAKGSMWI